MRCVGGVGDRAGPQSVAQREADIVLDHEVAQLVEHFIEGVLPLVVEHPFGQQGPAPADDPHDAFVQQRQVLPEHAGVDREEVYALFRLLLHRLQDDVVVDVLDLPAFDHLVDRHRPEGHGTMREQLGADGVEVAPGAQIHHRVGADRQGRLHLFDLRLDRAADAAGADIGVDLCPQGPADAGGLEIALEVNLIGGDHEPAGRDLVADKAGVQPFALGDLPHGLGDGSGSGFGQLCRHDSLLLAANKKIAPAGKRFVGSTPTCPSLSYAGLSAPWACILIRFRGCSLRPAIRQATPSDRRHCTEPRPVRRCNFVLFTIDMAVRPRSAIPHSRPGQDFPCGSLDLLRTSGLSSSSLANGQLLAAECVTGRDPNGY